MAASIVVFDVGGVLVDWHPDLAWADELGASGTKAFMERVKFDKLNVAADAGARFDDLADSLPDAEDARLLRMYPKKFAAAVQDRVPGVWEVASDLVAQGVPLHAITNWSAELWPIGVSVHPELGQIFGTTIVSGEVGIIKPSVEIFRILCKQAGITPQDCVFIDDGIHNVMAAKAAGMDGIHFTNADALRLGLEQRGLL